jgi:membrane associated rhomboid family serine protease
VTDPSGEPADTGGALSHCYRHPDRETGVRCTRCDRPICPQCMVPASVGFQCPECVAEGQKSVRPARTMYGGKVNRGGVDVTRVLIGINIAVFLITTISGAGVVSGRGQSSIYDRFALIPPAVADGDWHRLVTSMFLHYGLFHIAFNMWALYVIGSPLEQWLGRLRYLTLYFLSGIGGSVLSFATGSIAAQSAGASGAIFGLFGAFFIISRKRGLETGGIVGLIAINLVLSFTFNNIDWRGHVGGLIVGTAVGAVFAWSPTGPQRNRMQLLGCSAIAAVLVVASFLGARHNDNQWGDLVHAGLASSDTAYCAHYDPPE